MPVSGLANAVIPVQELAEMVERPLMTAVRRELSTAAADSADN